MRETKGKIKNAEKTYLKQMISDVLKLELQKITKNCETKAKLGSGQEKFETIKHKSNVLMINLGAMFDILTVRGKTLCNVGV